MEVDDEFERSDYPTPYDVIHEQTGDVKPYYPERLMDGRPWSKFIDEFLVEAIDGHLLEHFGKWCSIVIGKDSEELMANYLKFVTRSESFIYKVAVKLNQMYPKDISVLAGMKLMGQRYLNQPAIETFRQILVRAMKYGFALYRDTVLEPTTDPEEELAWDTYFREYAQRIDALINYFDLHDLVVECMTEAFKEIAEFTITRNCSDLTDNDMFARAISENAHLIEWMKMLNPAFHGITSHAMIYFTKTYVHYMIENCYELVVEYYPSTKSNMSQFLKTMKTLRWFGREKFVNKLISQIKQKLLKTGVPTKHILVSYANVAECLAFFDESCVMMHKVCQVIRDYVVTRQDTMRTIIRYVVSERPGLNETKQLTNMAYVDSNLDNVNDEYILAIEETKANVYEVWEPEPVDAEPTESRLIRQSADVFSMLVMIYGTKDMFVKEYRNFLADRLSVNGAHFDFREECAYIEMMKKRFQEGELNQCEVMLDDLLASERMFRNVSDVFDIRIISAEYWPDVNDIEGLDLPMFNQVQDAMGKIFEITKFNTRKLHFYKTYGASAVLKLTMGSVHVHVTVSMLNFHFINLFCEKEEWTMPEFEQKLGLTRAHATKTADWWADRGIIYRDGSVFRLSTDEANWAKLVKEAEERDNRSLPFGDDEEDEDSVEDAEDEDQELVDGMEEFWAYILSNIKMNAKKNNQSNPITAERLLSMFRLFGSPGKPQYQQKHVAMFMSRKVRAGLVYLENGVFKPAV
uniref:CULLIN_2 domain-containing protein n=1 Tax=Panagrellus redivivus TaxID=6233 RepID=A0A7E4VL86_PANRE